MVSPRIVEPEWLDVLPADDPRAMRSRRDLTRVNRVMMQTRIMARLLRRCAAQPPRSLLELGGGDGTFMLRIARLLAPHWPGISVRILDRQDIVGPETRDAFVRLGWPLETVAADVFEYFEGAGAAGVDIVAANLFLHHFRDAQLARLLSQAGGITRLFVACEPRRSRLALAGSRLLWGIGCNDVSRHDAMVSVRAGFSGRELSRLWPAGAGWELVEHEAGPFTHCFAARLAP